MSEVQRVDGYSSERRGRRLGRVFETVNAEDGTKFEIRWVEKERMFFASPEPGYEFRSEDPNALREALKEWIHENVTLSWEPLITLRHQNWSGHEGDFFGLDFERLFRATKKDGKFLFRNFEAEGECQNEWADVVKGRPGAPRSGVERGTLIIPYTPERWLELRRAKRSFEEMKRRANKFVQQNPEVVAKMLDSVASAPFLLPSPIEDERGKR